MFLSSPMKSFNDFVLEAYDKDLVGSASIRRTEDGKIGTPGRRKTPDQITRTKNIGGGKTVPVIQKTRKDAGITKDKVQAPQKERGSAEVKQTYADKAKEERRKAAQARIAARKRGQEVKKDTRTSKDLEKAATKMTAQKKTEKYKRVKTAAPGYTPRGPAKYSDKERRQIQKKGESELKKEFVRQETEKYKKATGQNPDRKGKTKIIGRATERMSK